jgi:hypothetical protein
VSTVTATIKRRCAAIHILRAVMLNNKDITPCPLLNSYLHCEGPYYLLLQGHAIQKQPLLYDNGKFWCLKATRRCKNIDAQPKMFLSVILSKQYIYTHNPFAHIFNIRHKNVQTK